MMTGGRPARDAPLSLVLLLFRPFVSVSNPFPGVTKSQSAFLFSADRLFSEEPKVYFWTFTWAKPMPDWYYANCWARFIRDLSNLYGGTLRGLKVVELHKEHGVHYHCLLNKRIWVGEVRRLAKRYGIGRVDVEEADFGGAMYLASYITPREKLFAGCSRWGTIGGFKGCRVKDVEIDSSFHRRMKRAQDVLGPKVPWLLSQLLFCHPEMTDEQVDAAAVQVQRTGSFTMALSAQKVMYSRDAQRRSMEALAR